MTEGTKIEETIEIEETIGIEEIKIVIKKMKFRGVIKNEQHSHYIIVIIIIIVVLRFLGKMGLSKECNKEFNNYISM